MYIRPSDETIKVLIDKLDIDHDGFVPLDHVVSLAAEEGLGIVVDDESSSKTIVSEGQKLREDGHRDVERERDAQRSPHHHHPHHDDQQKKKKSVGSDAITAGKEEPKPKKSDIVEDP